MSSLPTYEGRPLAYPDEPVFDQGLAFDLDTIMDRRRVLRLIGAAGVTASVAVGGPALRALAQSPSPDALTGVCQVIEEETAGPFPGDGSNGPDILTQSGVVRSDITSSFGTATGVAEGVPLAIQIALQDASNDCAPLAGAAVYAWHCTRDGLYSMYSEGVTDQNFLRGVQAADTDGVVTFQSIYPGCYSGRWPHIHFEVYPSLEAATDVANTIATSQVAMPQDASEAVYATAGYESSISSLAQVSLQSDNVFGNDGGIYQLGTITGDVTSGMTVTLVVPVATSASL
jgi:protocatechuate 3,4-dioxygenase beta subunit